MFPKTRSIKDLLLKIPMWVKAGARVAAVSCGQHPPWSYSLRTRTNCKCRDINNFILKMAQYVGSDFEIRCAERISECKCKNALTVDTPQQEFQRVSQVAVSEESSFSSTHLARHIGRGGSRCPVYTQTQGRGDTGTQGHGALWWEVPPKAHGVGSKAWDGRPAKPPG